jgi:alginate O-acetyltransferase complex protein AlgI
MFIYKNSGFFAGDYVKIVTSYWYLYLAGILFSTTLPKKIAEKNKIKFIENIVVIGIFWLSIYCLCTQANDPFMYFQF